MEVSRARPARPRVLLGSELGGGLGHVAMALRIADALAARGWEATIACPDPAKAAAFAGACAHALVQGVRLQRDPAFSQRDYLAHSFCDVLSWWGFGDATLLGGYLRDWQALLREVQPDVVIAEYAPALCLALRGDARLLAIGNGFCLPPGDGDGFPVLVRGGAPLRPQAAVLAAIEAALAGCGLPALGRLGQLHGRRTLVVALPQLDPYLDLRASAPVGPVDVAVECMPAAVATRWFGYLDVRFGCTGPVLGVLAESGMAGAVYLGGKGWEAVQGMGAGTGLDDAVEAMGSCCEGIAERVELHAVAPAYADMLAGASFVVHHGSAGLAQAALATGRPQLVLPTDLEKRLYGRMLEGMGVAVVLDGRYGVAQVRAAIAALGTAARRERAAAVAKTVARGGPWCGLQAVVDSCEAMVAASD